MTVSKYIISISPCVPGIFSRHGVHLAVLAVPVHTICICHFGEREIVHGDQ